MHLKDTESMIKSKKHRNLVEMSDSKTWASISIKTSFDMMSNRTNETHVLFVEPNKIV